MLAEAGVRLPQVIPAMEAVLTAGEGLDGPLRIPEEKKPIPARTPGGSGLAINFAC